MATGAELQRLRTSVSMSAKELAKEMNVDVERLRKWEQRNQNPRSEDAQKIMDFFGLSNLADLEKMKEMPPKKESISQANGRGSDVYVLDRRTDGSRSWYTNKHGNQFEPLTDGTYRVYHKHVLGPVHAAYAAGWGDPEFTESLPGRTSIVKEISEDLFLSFTVTGECQDDGTIDGIVPGMEITGQGLPRSMWQYKFPYMETNPLKKLPKIKMGNKEIEVPPKNKTYRYWIIVDRFKGMRVAMIKDQDVEKGILHCFCRNPDKKQYPDFQVNLDDCSQIFYVIKRVYND